jgi:hypothetical protein
LERQPNLGSLPEAEEAELASEGSNNWFAQSGFRFLQRAEKLQDYRNTHRGELDEEDLSEEQVE